MKNRSDIQNINLSLEKEDQGLDMNPNIVGSIYASMLLWIVKYHCHLFE